MNLRPPLLRLCTPRCGLLLMLLLLLGLASRPALAALSSEIKNSPDGAKNEKIISDTVAAEIVDLAGDDPVKRGRARESLAGEVNAPGSQPFSGAFLDLYAQQLNTQLLPLAGNPDPRIRLNAAIVAQRVAEKVDNSRLFGLTDAMLGDKSDAVRIWALKSARCVLPPVVQAGLQANQTKLIASIKQHADNPILLPLVYDALSMNYQAIKGNPPGRNKVTAVGVNEVLALLSQRLARYQKQLPPEPQADVPAIVFLSNPTTWNALNGVPQSAVQLQIVQTLSDAAVVIGRRAAAAQGAGRGDLEIVVQKLASALGAIALTASAKDVFDKLQPLIRSGPNNAGLLDLVNTVPATLKTFPAWASLKAPPAVDVVTASTAPASSATPK